MAEKWDYWLYSMNTPFGRTRGGEPDSPYQGFCTITYFQICRGLDQVRGLASTHNGEPRAGGRRRGRGNRRRHGTRLWRFLWRRSRRCAGGQQAAARSRAQVQAGSRLRCLPTPTWSCAGNCSLFFVRESARRRRPWSGRLPAATPPRRAGAHQRRRQPAAHPRPGSRPASGPRRRAGSATPSLDMTGARAAMPCPPPSIQSGRATGETRGLEVATGRPGHDSRCEHSTKSIVRGVWLPAASAPERCVHRVKPVIPYFGH